MVGSLSSSHEAVSHRKLQPGGGATLTYEDASGLDLVSRLLGSSPYFRSLRPTPLRCFPRLLLQKTSVFGSLPNDYLSSSSLEDFKPFTLYTTSIRYGLPKLQSHLTAALPLNLTHRSTVFARALVKALPRVVCLVPPSFTSLTLTPTPLRLLTMTNCSSFDLLLEDLSISFDLTCTNKLPSFWFKALKDLISINPIYPFMFLMLSYLMFSLGYALYCDVLNFGNSFPLHLCIWFPW
ncbi:Glycosyl hydrolase family 35 protein [Arabidopsis thaliana]|uniref:Glycosyl hydrolase family 35 protein n=1 Tax=Arabidopsis thaliana TaxID=3702 RepID=A0A1I9LSG0_ARATH|nr:Glycosyl hydrolase family 35 protein [Arabidopsis thaliana]ANM65518.1 Glycosyl hydrolase family 35 protein [Arabidopsis thaliana]|eukprot:NP_001327478.1 Glycosyl hydrolase family 35 protein [Arabidopsis thaliana]